MAEDNESPAGCLPLIGVIAIGIGVGIIWGDGYGWIACGVACLILAAVIIYRRG